MENSNEYTYVQYRKNEIKIKNKIDFPIIKFDDYIKKLINDIFHSIPKITNSNSQNTFSIKDIKNNLHEKENIIFVGLNYLEKNLGENFNLGNFINEQALNSFLKKSDMDEQAFNRFLEKADLDGQTLNSFLGLKEIAIKTNQFVNFINTVKICQFKLMKAFYQITNTFNEYQIFLIHHNQDKQKIIKSCLIDHNQDIILALSKSEKNESEILESIKKIIMDYFNEITKNIKEQECLNASTFIKKHEELDIIKKLEDMRSYILSKESISQLVTFFDDEQSKFPLLNISTMEKDKIDFDDNNKNANKYFFLLLNISKYHIHLNSQDIMKILNSILEFYKSYICQNQKKQIEKEIANLNGNDNNKESIEKQIENYEKNNKYFYFELIFKKIMRNLVNKDVFKIYHKLLISDDTKEDDLEDYYFSAFDLICFSNSLGYSLFAIDRDFNFCVEKIYNQNARREVIEKELIIFKENKSKFIINLLQYSKEDKIFFPYFPLRTLKQCLFSVKSKVDFTLVDRIVMIKEIAIALNDLYELNQKHGNFSIGSIYINSDKDAYLGEIAYDRQKENELTKTPEKVIYRAPEILLKQCEEDEYILADIYSFGLTMYDIITGESVQSLLRKKARFQLYKLLQEGVYKYLFSDENPLFNPLAFDIKGDSLIGVKELIEKCTKKNPEERFQSFKEIIYSIENLAIYENNKEEINYRIDHAKNASTYNCQLTDLIEAYYTSGDKSILKNIENIFEEINNYLYSSSNKSFHFGDDIIESIFKYFDMKFVDD